MTSEVIAARPARNHPGERTTQEADMNRTNVLWTTLFVSSAMTALRGAARVEAGGALAIRLRHLVLAVLRTVADFAHAAAILASLQLAGRRAAAASER
jgi:hypothetical protein